MNPILKRKAIRKAWKKLNSEEQDRKVAHYVDIFKTMLGLEVNKEKELWIDATFEMIRTQREENNYELLKPVEYAMRYKRRKDPTLFIDSVLFPNLEHAGSIIRFMMYYLGKELLNSIGVWDFYEDPSLTISKKVKDQTESKPKKKANKKPKPKKNVEKNQKPTAGTTENEDSPSHEGFNKAILKGRKAISEVSSQDELPKTNWDALINAADDDWIPVDEKKKKAYLQKTSLQQPNKDQKKNQLYISDNEQKKTMSSKKKKKKSVSQTRSVTSEGKGNEKKPEDSTLKGPSQCVAVDANHIAESMKATKALNDKVMAADKEELEQKGKKLIECNVFSESVQSESNLEIRSSLASIESESNNVLTEGTSTSKVQVKDEAISNNTSTKSSKLRPPTKSKPFVHLEANNVIPNLSSQIAPSLIYPFVFRDNQKKGGSKVQTRLIATMNEKDKRFYEYVNKDIELLLTNMELRTVRIKAAFSCIHQRIKKVVKKTFEDATHLKSEVYGSYSTNLLLDSSDMDICLVGFEKLDRVKAIDVLQTLSCNLSLFNWCISVNFIRQATVPVIKIVNSCDSGSQPFRILYRS